VNSSAVLTITFTFSYCVIGCLCLIDTFFNYSCPLSFVSLWPLRSMLQWYVAFIVFWPAKEVLSTSESVSQNECVHQPFFFSRPSSSYLFRLLVCCPLQSESASPLVAVSSPRGVNKNWRSLLPRMPLPRESSRG
jgi:hypothetical protein